MLLLLVWHGSAMALKLDVQIQGLDGQEAELNNVQALLAIYQERDGEGLSVPRLLALHREAPEQIRKALAPFGYYRVEVEDALTEPRTQDGTWRASYRITTGDPVRIAEVNYAVTGPGADSTAFPNEFPMDVGDVLLHSEYEKAKSDLRYMATSEGYLDYRATRHRVLVDPVAYDAVIDMEIETGPRYYLGEVQFKQDLLEEDLLRRYVKFDPGAVYDPDLLLDLQARLLGTQYFKSVEIVPLRDQMGAGTRVPIDVVATRNKPNKYRVGVGFATDTGPRFTLDWQRRYLNRWGHKLHSQLQVSQRLSFINLDYRIPIRDPVRDYIAIKPDITYYDTSTRKGWVYQVQAAHSTVTPRGWRRNIGIDYRYEDYELNDVESGTSNEIVPNISWSKTVADDPINTRNGYRLKYTVLGTVEGIVSEASYLSGTVSFKWIKSLSEDFRLITRTDLGATLADSVADLPASRRFYTGGDNTIRGWGIDALGPIDPATGQVVGGRYLAVGSLELERRVTGPWGVALFTDFGNAFDPDYDQEFKQSVGLGLRYASPIGPVRLDLAFAVTKDNDNGGFPPARLHIVLGPDL